MENPKEPKTGTVHIFHNNAFVHTVLSLIALVEDWDAATILQAIRDGLANLYNKKNVC